MTGKHSVREKLKTMSSTQRNGGGGVQNSKMPHMVTRLPIGDLNQHLTCALCSGYMIDATTVVECLHSFCRACLLRYLETSSTCPICDTQINKAQLDKCVRADHTLQDLVYKLVPGLYKSELQRRKDFYLEQCKSVADDAPSSSSSSVKSDSLVPSGMQIFDKHLVELSAFICTPDEIVSFSLESAPKKLQSVDSPSKSTTQNQSSTVQSDSSKINNKKKENGKKMEDLHFKRYFRCPAAVTIGHLKKLLACKMDLSTSYQIEILHSDEPLLEEYTLMDIAYIYTWRRKAPMQLFFNICKYESEEEPMPQLEPEVAASISPSTSTRAPPAVDTDSKEDIKNMETADALSSLQQRPVDTNASEKSLTGDYSLSDRPKLTDGPTTNGTSAPGHSPARQDLNSIGDILKIACRPSHPLLSETSMRGKPPLPIDQFNGPSQRKQAPIVNGKMPHIRLAEPLPRKVWKKKTSSDGESQKQTKPRKPKAPKLLPSPNTLVTLQKITTLVPYCDTASAISKEQSTNMDSICMDTSGASTNPSSPSAATTSPLSSPHAAYKPTAAQSACTQPAKLRFKKSLISVVQKLSSKNALEACTTSKKQKLEENGMEEMGGATLIH